jgi:hypothetical protein
MGGFPFQGVRFGGLKSVKFGLLPLPPHYPPGVAARPSTRLRRVARLALRALLRTAPKPKQRCADYPTSGSPIQPSSAFEDPLCIPCSELSQSSHNTVRPGTGTVCASRMMPNRKYGRLHLLMKARTEATEEDRTAVRPFIPGGGAWGMGGLPPGWSPHRVMPSLWGPIAYSPGEAVS